MDKETTGAWGGWRGACWLLAASTVIFRAYQAGDLYAASPGGNPCHVSRSFLPSREVSVAPSGGDFTRIQDALNGATPGTRITVRAGTYNEKLVVNVGGSAAGGWVTVRAYPGESVVLDGTGVAGGDMILVEDRDYVRIEGLTIRNNLNVNDGSGVRVIGTCRHIRIQNNRIHDMRGSDAMGITVYGTRQTPCSEIDIIGNHVHDCDAAQSEAVTLNGNVDGFQVLSNTVHDINNIGIDFIGGEQDVGPYGVCRNGVCRSNHVYRCRSNYGGGYAAGIYVDGGSGILLEHNRVHECDLGMEIGAENPSIVTSGIVVRGNILYDNDKVGIMFGGYEQSRGRVAHCRFANNTCYRNDTLADGNGELGISWAYSNTVENNIFYVGPQALMIGSYEGNTDNRLDYNLWFLEGAGNDAVFAWNGTEYAGLSAYRQGTGQGTHSLFADPLLVNAAGVDFHVAATSVVVDAGSNDYTFDPAVFDMDGEHRVMGERVDIGVDEISGFWRWRDTSFGVLGAAYTSNKAAPRFGRHGDYDGDGLRNYGEYLWRSDPLSRDGAAGRIGIRARGSDEVLVSFASRSNRVFRLRAAASLSPPDWFAVGPPLVFFSEAMQSVTQNVSGASIRYYRVRVAE